MTTPAHHRTLSVAAATAAVDLGVKLAAVRWLTEPLDATVVAVRLAYNPGVAFSLGADQPVAVVAAVTSMIIVVFTIAAWRGHLGGPITAGLVIGGGVANLADRLADGSVVDLFDLGWWPVFNLADVALITGVALLTLTTVTQQPTPAANPAGDPAQESRGNGA